MEVAFAVDVDGTVRVHATDLLTKTVASARFVSSKQLGRDEIMRLVKEAEAVAGHDRQERRRIEAGIEADSAITGETALTRLARGAESIRAHEADDALGLRQSREALADGSVPGIHRRCAEL